MARGTQHRKRRPPANAAVAPSPQGQGQAAEAAPRWEDQLFFARLRGHAKWVFVFLALVFALSFVLFGVGSGSTGIGDSLRTSSATSSALGRRHSRRPLEKKTRRTRRTRKAWRELATAQEQKDNLDAAIVALHALHRRSGRRTRTGCRSSPGSTCAARTLRAAYIAAQTKRQPLVAGVPVHAGVVSPLAQALDDPISAAISTSTRSDTRTPYSKYLDTQTKAVGVYKQIVALNPKDATHQYRLAQVAQPRTTSRRDRRLHAFLKLAPDDSLAPAAKKALKQLKRLPRASLRPLARLRLAGQPPAKSGDDELRHQGRAALRPSSSSRSRARSTSTSRRS